MVEGKRGMKGRKWALTAGGGLAAAALLWGCLNTVSAPNSAAPESAALEADQRSGESEKAAAEPFTITVLAEGTPGASGSRALAGPDSGNVMALDSLRNMVQLIVANDAGYVTGFAESRKDVDSTGTVSLGVSLPAGENYHFLVLQGHWPYTGGKGGYGYEDKPPTLLSAGFASSPIESGANTITIKQQILATDIAFVPAAGSGFKQVEPRTGGIALLVPGKWSLNWTAQKGRVEAGIAQAGAGGNGFEALLEARKALNPIAVDPGFRSAQRSLNGGPEAESLDLSVSGNLISLNLDLAVDAAGSANYNLEYAPFGLTGIGAGWGDYDLDSHFDLSKGGPVWIIRNGLNDAAQDANTDFNSVGVGGKNGNGAVSYRVLDPDEDEDEDGILNGQEIRWGTDPGAADGGPGDSDKDGFSNEMEAANGFNPYDREDNPGKAQPGPLTVSNGKELGKRSGPVATIRFTTGGYAGIAKGYYRVVAQGAPPPAYSSYEPFDLAETSGNNAGIQTLTVSLSDAWKAGYDVYVLIMKDRNVSLPLCVPLAEISGVGMDLDW